MLVTILPSKRKRRQEHITATLVGVVKERAILPVALYGNMVVSTRSDFMFDKNVWEAIPTEVRVDLRKVAKEIVGECKKHYPNDCEDCRYGDSIGLCCFKQEPPTWDFGTTNEATPPDMVNKPAHYVKGGMECIDFIRAIVSDLTPYEAYCLGNVVKYLWRFKDKNGVVDLDKAVRYIEFLKEAQGNEVEA